MFLFILALGLSVEIAAVLRNIFVGGLCCICDLAVRLRGINCSSVTQYPVVPLLHILIKIDQLILAELVSQPFSAVESVLSVFVFL